MDNAPLEIWFLIIDALGPKRNQYGEKLEEPSVAALQACALTCQAWLDRARHHLYKDIYLHKGEQFFQFSQTIVQSPSLGRLVDIIECDLYGNGDYDVMDTPLDKIQTPLSPFVVSRLANLKRASFFGGGSDTSLPVPFVHFIRSFSVCDKLRQLALYNIYLNEIDYVVGTVWSFPQIDSLLVKDCDWPLIDVDDEYHSYHPECHRPRLTTLEIYLPRVEEDIVIDVVLLVVNTTPNRLETLKLWLNSHIAFEQKFLRAYFIAKWLAKPPNYAALHTEVPLFNSLRTLNLTVEQTDVAWVGRLIGRIRSERMEEISIDHLVKVVIPIGKIVKRYKKSRLDDLLSAQQFQHLKHLGITIYANNAVDKRVGQRWGEVIGDRCFRQCRDRGILNIKAKLCLYFPLTSPWICC
ncbi:hypothetical protein C8Q74DRAFT_1265315 [Fomes fomentarius]|nr:hypothetical protein C8Q74DRAFT_1265315 [Fomes fomentarius]